MTPAAVTAKYVVGPDRYRDLAALVGETSDNLPGRARRRREDRRQVDHEYGALDGMVAHVDEVKGKAGDSLRDHLAGVLRNYELNRLVRRPRPAAAARRHEWHGWDREAVHQVFDALEFRVLRDRLY